MGGVLLLLARFGLAGLVGFEGLNWAGLLDFTLDFSWLGLIVTAGAVAVMLEGTSVALRRATGRALHPLVYVLAVIGLSVDAFGDIAHLYGRFAWYDQLAHLVGGGVVAAAMLSILWQLEQAGRIRLGSIGRGLAAVALAAFFGSLYEIEEYLEDAWKWHRQVRLGDGPDTANDILFNILGALAVAVIASIVVYLRNRHGASQPGGMEPTHPRTP